MPVDDHEVHARVIHEKPPAGCYSRQDFKPAYFVIERYYFDDGTYEMRGTWIPHMMSTRCRQDMPLPECEGCTADKDVEYLEKSRTWK